MEAELVYNGQKTSMIYASMVPTFLQKCSGFGFAINIYEEKTKINAKLKLFENIQNIFKENKWSEPIKIPENIYKYCAVSQYNKNILSIIPNKIHNGCIYLVHLRNNSEIRIYKKLSFKNILLFPYINILVLCASEYQSVYLNPMLAEQTISTYSYSLTTEIIYIDKLTFKFINGNLYIFTSKESEECFYKIMVKQI